jgi:mannose-6-phosphate isomerase-like protein (cupin superfamily)
LPGISPDPGAGFVGDVDAPAATRPTIRGMAYAHVDAADIPLGVGEHPATSPFDRRISERLGLTGFAVYRVDLPPYAETVRHDHRYDQVEDMYAFIEGSGWLVLGEKEVRVVAGQFAAVTVEEERHLRAGDEGLVLIAVCGRGSRE